MHLDMEVPPGQVTVEGAGAGQGGEEPSLTRV